MILGEENSAWNYDEKSEEWFLALFTPEQPVCYHVKHYKITPL